MTAGQAIHVSQRHDRHAVLVAELALRIAEFTPVGTVLGERLTDLKSLFGNHTTRRGDLTAVRADGLRIVLEVVAHDNQKFGEKVDFWAEQLATPGHGYGMTMVVFVVAADPNSGASRARGLRGRVSAAIVKARAKHGATWRGHDRMGMVSWDDWFPAAGEMSQAFSSLTVRFPESRLTHASVLDAEVVPCAHPGDREYVAVIENASLLAQTPAWLRSRARARRVLHRMGLPRLTDLPSPPLAKPKPATFDQQGTRSRRKSEAAATTPGDPGRTRRPSRHHRNPATSATPTAAAAVDTSGGPTATAPTANRGDAGTRTAGLGRGTCDLRTASLLSRRAPDPGEDRVDQRRESSPYRCWTCSRFVVGDVEVSQALRCGALADAYDAPARGEQGPRLVPIAASSVGGVVVAQPVVLDDHPQRRAGRCRSGREATCHAGRATGPHLRARCSTALPVR